MRMLAKMSRLCICHIECTRFILDNVRLEFGMAYSIDKKRSVSLIDKTAIKLLNYFSAIDTAYRLDIYRNRHCYVLQSHIYSNS